MDTLRMNDTCTGSSSRTPVNSLNRTLSKARPDSSTGLMTPLKTESSRIGSATMPVNALKRTAQEAGLDGMGSLTPPKTSSVPSKPPMRLKLKMPQREVSTEEDRKHKTQKPATERKQPSLKRPMPRTRERKAAEKAKLNIPQQEITKEEARTRKIRKAAAERWEPKLQRPMPSRSELNAAYNNKLLRHYTDETTPAAGGFVKPHINRSARVEKLLKALSISPAHSPAQSASERQAELDKKAINDAVLEHNIKVALERNSEITNSDYAKRLAWQAFSSNEQDRIDRGRQAMLISGLEVKDIKRERLGKANHLPEWRKTNTGRFAKSG